MATSVKQIEKEFLLATAKREAAVIALKVGGGEWSVRIVDITPRGIIYSHGVPLQLLRKGSICDFHYTVRDQTITYKAPILEPGELRMLAGMPEKLYKNISRRFARLAPPTDLSVSFSFAGERYDLDFPASAAFNPDREPEPSQDFDPGDLRNLMVDFERKAMLIGTDRGIVMFKDRQPTSVEERLSTSTGRSFFLPSCMSGIPASDPFANRTILTKADFLEHFTTEGLESPFAEAELLKLEQSKRADGLISELLVPILFQDYAIGCARIANRQQTKPPFDLQVVETFVNFARIFAWSLKLHGYFKNSPKLDKQYRTQVVDVSAGGLLFACGDKRLSQALKEGLQVTVRLQAHQRAVNAAGRIRQHYTGSSDAFFGIEFTIMAPEDFRFLFEYLYGRQFTDGDTTSVESARLARS
jgi:hypothetical protein